MVTRDQVKTLLVGPCVSLRFLLRPDAELKERNGMESFSDSAYFHRMHSLAWTLGDERAVA